MTCQSVLTWGKRTLIWNLLFQLRLLIITGLLDVKLQSKYFISSISLNPNNPRGFRCTIIVPILQLRYPRWPQTSSLAMGPEYSRGRSRTWPSVPKVQHLTRRSNLYARITCLQAQWIAIKISFKLWITVKTV